MFDYTKKSDEQGTVTFEVTIKNDTVKKKFEETLKHIAKHTEIEGFRKGTAPVEVARKHISKEKVYDELIQNLLPDIYKDILAKESIKPIISPRVELKNAKEDEDWLLEMGVAREPKVTLPDYKKIMKDAQGELKKEDIWVPGKSQEKPTEEQAKVREKTLNAILDQLVKKTKIELSDIIIEHETNKRLSRLVDDVKKLGLTVDAYLESKNLTQEKLKEQFKNDILSTYKLEYALNEIGDKEKISVGKEEIEKLFANIQDEQEKKTAQQNAYVYSSMLRKQKIIDFLVSS